VCLCITVIIVTEMEDYYQDDYYFIPDIFNETKTKCCSEGKILAEVTGVWSCVKYTAHIEDVLSLFRNIDNSSLSSEIQIEADSDIIDKVCNTDEVVSVLSPSTIDFTDDFAMSNDGGEFFECIDVTRDILADHIYPVVVSCIEQDDLLLTCESGGTERIFYLIFGIVSILAIFTSLIVYAVLPKQLLNIHGKVVVGNFISCLMFLIFLMIMYSSCWTLWPLPHTTACRIVGYFGYYSTMAMFSWMFSLCLDLFCTFFKSGRLVTSSCFLYYCLIGWGVPSLLLLVILLLDHVDQGHLVQPPSVGMQSCFLHEDAMNMFLHLPIFMFMLINTLFYLYTVFNIFKTRNSIKNNVKGNKMKDNALIFTKLFLVMGILWGFEIVSLHVHNSSFSLVFGILNISRGSFMFVIFILKSSVFKGLKELFEPISNMEERTNLQSRSITTCGKTETSLCDTQF